MTSFTIDNDAAITLQNAIRKYYAQNELANLQSSILPRKIFEIGRKYASDQKMLNKLSHPMQGRQAARIYMADDLPLVIRKCPNNAIRYRNMEQARNLCRKLDLQHVVIPKARLVHPFLFEEKILDSHASSIKGMAFYYQNQDLFGDAIVDFIRFLCSSKLDDLVGNSDHIINSLNLGNIPRFENLLLYSVEEKGKTEIKVSPIDIENFALGIPNLQNIYLAIKIGVQLFPYHARLITNTAKSCCIKQEELKKQLPRFEKTIESLENQSKNLYSKMVVNGLAYFKEHQITPSNHHWIPISEQRKSAIGGKIKQTLMDIHKQALPQLYWNPKGCLLGNSEESAEKFRTEVFPKMLELIENVFSETCKQILKDKLKFEGELLESRMNRFSLANSLSDDFYKVYPSIHTSILAESESVLPVIFKEILKDMAANGEMLYYKILYKEEFFII